MTVSTKKGERIYPLNKVQSFEGISPQHVALSMYPMGPALKETYYAPPNG